MEINSSLHSCSWSFYLVSILSWVSSTLRSTEYCDTAVIHSSVYNVCSYILLVRLYHVLYRYMEILMLHLITSHLFIMHISDTTNLILTEHVAIMFLKLFIPANMFTISSSNFKDKKMFSSLFKRVLYSLSVIFLIILLFLR